MLDLIEKKKSGLRHSPEELRFIARCAADGAVPDYQLSSGLMAVFLRGMDPAETAALTQAMASTGRRLPLAGLKGPVVDKHSTGGVGDGISLALAPLAAAAGLKVPMMSGRGLGHTGGTLDKLEAIPGFRVHLTPGQILRQLRSTGVAMFGQTRDLAPADRRLYALRDATATVASIPLIVSSILSKKLAENLDALVLDAKIGPGAIFPDAASQRELAAHLVQTGRKLGLRSVAVLTRMEEPLGRAVGNALEVRQAVEVLQGSGPSDFLEVLKVLGGWMLVLGGKARTWEEGAETLERLRISGGGLRSFREMVRWQGGDPRVADDPDRLLPKAPFQTQVRAAQDGYVAALDAREVGRIAVRLGAGRAKAEDAVDASAGIVLFKKRGEAVRRGDLLATLHGSDRRRIGEAAQAFRQTLRIQRRPFWPPKVIVGVVR